MTRVLLPMRPETPDMNLPAPCPAESGGAGLSRRSLLLGGLAAPFGLRSPPAGAASGTARDVVSYRGALAAVAGRYRFALVDIRADWCAVCRRIEHEILSHPAVQRHLERVPLVKVDVTTMDEDNRRLLAYLRASGPPPFFVIEAATGREYRKTRSLGSFSRRDLIRRLQPFTQL